MFDLIAKLIGSLRSSTPKTVERPRADSPRDRMIESLKAGTAPAGLAIDGIVDLSMRVVGKLNLKLPNQMSATVLDLSGQELETLPAGFSADELRLNGCPIRTVPTDVRVSMKLDLSECDRLESLPPGLTIGTLVLRNCTALRQLPEGLDVWFLDLTGCHALDRWPDQITIRGGHLRLAGCTAITTLPPGLQRLSALSVRDCPNLSQLPPDLSITGWIDVAHSGISESSLPPGLAETQIRWAGINVDRRTAFHPESIQVAEVLSEKNAERRRVMLERYGFGRFLKDAGAELRDRDRDPGGERQLMRIELPGDEDLVAMSCFCPSTGRQYIIRVPPATTTCRQAAAWIAGFDNPDDYRPLIET
jgi:hypothetical protein